MNRIKLLLTGIMVFALLFSYDLPVQGLTDEEPIPEKAKLAIDKALRYLAKKQQKDGSWIESGKKCTGIVALALMGFMAAGNTPGEGPYGSNVALGLEWMLKQCQPNGLIAKDVVGSGPMYSQGLATLFLAEAWGMTRREDVHDKLKNAVELIIKTQNREGGWRYHPVARDADLSVTIMQLMALRAASNCGITVPGDTIENAIGYVKKCAEKNKDGSFSYQANRGNGGDFSFARTAAGVMSLQIAGNYKAEEVKQGLDHLMRVMDEPKGNHDRQWFNYGHYYAAQAMYQAGEPYWSKWYPFIIDRMTKKQRKDGSWSGSRAGATGTTGFAILTLAIPYRYLPIYQR